MLDPELLYALDAFHGEAYVGMTWRVTWAGRDPLAGSSGGGRWSPDDGFEVLYTSLDRNGALAEVHHHLSKAPVFSSSDMTINEIEVELKSIVRLCADRLRSLGWSEQSGVRENYALTRSIGVAAHLLDFEGVIVPSMRWECENLVIFLDRIDAESRLAVKHTTDVNWHRWRKDSRID